MRFVRLCGLALALAAPCPSAMAQAPAAPTIATVAVGEGALTAVWAAPAGATGITGYDLRHIDSGATDKSDANWTVNEDVQEDEALRAFVLGLTNGTSYDLQVRAVADTTDGAWSATVTGTPASAGTTRSSAVELTLDVPIYATIEPGDAIDYFELELDAATTLLIFSEGRSADPKAEFQTSTGGYLSLNDEAEFAYRYLGRRGENLGYPGMGNNFLIARKNQAAGTYYLKVEPYRSNTGTEALPYVLTVRTITDAGDSIAAATPVVARRPATGQIDSATDVDYFRFALTEETAVRFYAATLLIAEIFDDRLPFDEIDLEADVVDADDNAVNAVIHSTGQESHDEDGHPHLAFTTRAILPAGAHYLKVSSPSGETGTYLLNIYADAGPVTESPTDFSPCPASNEDDTLYGCQWHLNNTNQHGSGGGQDINVETVWDTNKGEGVNVAIVDSGMQWTHDDLFPNLSFSRGRNYQDTSFGLNPLPNDIDQDYLLRLILPGFPGYAFPDHGTWVAGVIAARDNDIGVRGVAPRATIYGYNLLLGLNNTDRNRADATSRNAATTQVSNNSWGFVDRGWPSLPSRSWEMAVETGVASGNGVSYVFAGGNGHLIGDHANLNGYISFHAVTAVCAINYDDERASFSEIGSNLWVCAPSGNDATNETAITTTDRFHRYTSEFDGTSAATPTVSGVLALVRAANTALTWRDARLILAASARKNDATNTGWLTGALKYGSTTERYNFNHEYGFGAVDAQAAVTLADGWTNVRSYRQQSARSDTDIAIPDLPSSGEKTPATGTVTLGAHVTFVEYVEVQAKFDHTAFRNLDIELESPSGAVSELLTHAVRDPDDADQRQGAFQGTHRFGSARHLGEDSEGTWTLRVTDAIRAASGRNGDGKIESWQLRVYGIGDIPAAPGIESVTASDHALELTWTAPQDSGLSAITAYDVRYISTWAPDKSEANWTLIDDAWTSGDLTYTIGSLEVGASYDIQVRGVNDEGDGTWSATTTVRTTLPEVTASFESASYAIAEGARLDVPVVLSAAPERAVTVRVEASGADGAGTGDFTTGTDRLTFYATDTRKTLQVSATDDSVEDPGESVSLRLSAFSEAVSAGAIATTKVAIQDDDYTFTPSFAAGAGVTESATDVYTVSEGTGSAALKLAIQAPDDVMAEDVPGPVTVTWSTRANAGNRGAGESYATQASDGIYGDFGGHSGDIAFALADFSNDTVCDCARAEKSLSADIHDDRVQESTEVFGLRVEGSSLSGRKDITVKVLDDDPAPSLTLSAAPLTVAEAGGESTVTVSTGSGSTFETAQTIDIDTAAASTATDADYSLSARRLTLPAGSGVAASTVTATLTGLDDAIDDDNETVVLAGQHDGSEFARETVTILDDDDASTHIDLSVSPPSIGEGASAAVVVTATLNAGARQEDTEVTVRYGDDGDSAVAGTDYDALSEQTLTIPAEETSGSVTVTLKSVNDSIDEADETLSVGGSTAALTVTGTVFEIADDDPLPAPELKLDRSTLAEAGGTATVTVTTGQGSTFEADTTITLTFSGTATDGTDYTASSRTLTLPAGMGTEASTVAMTLTGEDDELDDDGETIVITGSRAGTPLASRQTVVIEDDDDPEITVTFRATDYRLGEGGAIDIPVTLSAVPERAVTIPIEVEAAGDATSSDYSVSPAGLSFGANQTSKTVRVRAADDSVVDPGESVLLRFGTLPERVSEGGIGTVTVAIRDEDYTFAPVFSPLGGTAAAGDIYMVGEGAGALRLALSLETPGGVGSVDVAAPVVVGLSARENAGSLGTGEDHASQRRPGVFGDFAPLEADVAFAPGDFSDDGACGCARAEKTVSVDLFDDRVHEGTEVFGLRLARVSGRLSVATRDLTVKVRDDDDEPVLVLGAEPAIIEESGGASTVTVSTGTGSTFPNAQTIDLELSGTATENTDYEIDAKRLTLPAGSGVDTSSVTTAVRSLDDVIDDDAETVVLSAARGGTAFANVTVTIADDEDASTRVDLAVVPAQVREDAGSTTVRVTATLDAGARAEDTEVSVTVGSAGDSAVAGTDYETVNALTMTIDAGQTGAEATFTLRPTNDDTAEGAESITVDGSADLAVRSASLVLNDDDVESTEVVLTLDPDRVSEDAGSRTVRITGTLNGGALTEEKAVAVTVGDLLDTAEEGTDYTAVGDLTLRIPANRTSGTATFRLQAVNDPTAEGDEAISVSGTVDGLVVTGTELILVDDEAASTQVALTLAPSSVPESAATDVTVTGTLDAGARATEVVVTVSVGRATDAAAVGADYATVPELTLAIPANEVEAEATFTLMPEDDAIAEGSETITVEGTTGELIVVPAALTLTDNDTASRTVTLSVAPETVREGAAESITVTGMLDAGARDDDTTVRLTVGAADDTAVAGADYEAVLEQFLTILAGETTGTVNFLLVPRDNSEGDGERRLKVRGTTAAALRVEPVAGASIALLDDDVPEIRVDPDALEVPEAESRTYNVVLGTHPSADVTVTVGGVSGDLSVDKPSLVFTPGDWSVWQAVTVTAADDADNTQDADLVLRHRASGAAEYRGLHADVAVRILENDPSLVFDATSLTVPEGGEAAYTVALAIAPTDIVAVIIEGVSGDLSLSETELYFAPGDWSNPQPVTVRAAEDEDTSTDPSVTLTHRASGGGYDGVVGTVRVSITEKDSPPPSGGGGGGGGAANIPPVVEREIEDQTLDAGEVLELDIQLNFYDRNQRALDYSVTSADPSVATVTVNRQGVLTIEGLRRGVTAVTVTAADRRDERASDTFVVTVRGPALVALVPRAADLVREGFVRVINHSDEAGEVSIEAIDDTGVRYGPVTLILDAGETQHFNSGDLEDGNPAKGLPDGVGPGEGDWRLVLDSELDIEVLAYIRTEDGLLTAMHDTVPVRDGSYRVAIFNPGSNVNQVSRLRLINPGDAPAEVTVTGTDDAGASPGTTVMFDIPAGESLTLSASDLESGVGVNGALGDGVGKWRLEVASTEPIVAMSLLSSPTGHLTNLSTIPEAPDGEDGKHLVPLFPSASDPLGRQGFVRAVNRSTEEGTVSIEAYDDSDEIYETVMLSIGAGETVHFNSNDLELGNAAKGLSGSTGAGMGDWRLVLSSEAIDVLAYIRTTDGFLTSMHDVAPTLEGAHRVVIFNPGSNPNQVSGLRLVNPGSEYAEVTITGIDDAGASPGSAVVLTVPAGGSRTLPAAELESGGDGLTGALADGAGKWRMRVESEAPIFVMSLLESPTGHLTNLSTAP